MNDIAMCTNVFCPIKNMCARQEYGDQKVTETRIYTTSLFKPTVKTKPNGVEVKCEYFIPKEKTNVK